MSEKLTENKLENKSISETTKGSFFENYIRPMQGDASWSFVTQLVTIAQSLLATSLVYGFIYYVTSIFSWLIIIGLFAISFVLYVLAFYLQKRLIMATVSQGESVAEPLGTNSLATTNSDIQPKSAPKPLKKALAVSAVVIAVLVAGFFLGRLGSQPSNDNIDLQGFNDPSRHIRVMDRKFSNERVVLDGYHYEGCTFTNVTFVYNGKSGFGFKHNKLKGTFTVDTDNPSINGTFALFKGLGLMRPDVPLQDINEDIPKNVEPLEIIQPSRN